LFQLLSRSFVLLLLNWRRYGGKQCSRTYRKSLRYKKRHPTFPFLVKGFYSGLLGFFRLLLRWPICYKMQRVMIIKKNHARTPLPASSPPASLSFFVLPPPPPSKNVTAKQTILVHTKKAPATIETPKPEPPPQPTYILVFLFLFLLPPLSSLGVTRWVEGRQIGGVIGVCCPVLFLVNTSPYYFSPTSLPPPPPPFSSLPPPPHRRQRNQLLRPKAKRNSRSNAITQPVDDSPCFLSPPFSFFLFPSFLGRSRGARLSVRKAPLLQNPPSPFS